MTNANSAVALYLGEAGKSEMESGTSAAKASCFQGFAHQASSGFLIMACNKAAIRRHVEQTEGVSRTWFEWTIDGAHLVKNLIVEVNFDTDPTSSECRMDTLNAIRAYVIGGEDGEGTADAMHLRIVPPVGSSLNR
jgi:hypothetical protein